MTGSPHNAGLARAREIMDRALAAPNGVRIPFLDADHVNSEGAEKAANSLRQRCFNARGALRRTLAQLTTPGEPPPQVAYDSLVFQVIRDEPQTRWLLVALKPVNDGIEEF